MKLKVIVLCTCLTFLLVAAVVAGAQHSQPPPAMGQDPISQNLFPPEMVMNHRQALSLSDEQKGAIKDEVIKASSRFSELQWQMQDEMETMVALTKGTSIDEARAMAELDKILGIEREVKRTQLTLAIRIKNKLTAEQQSKLMEIQRNSRDIAPRPPDR